MHSDYVDNWDSLPAPVQEALSPIITRFDEGADLLFDRRRNLSFEAAVKELSVPGIVALTDGLRQLRGMLEQHIAITNAAQGDLLFDGIYPLTAYDLPLYTPAVYLSQLAQAMDEQNVRVWKDSTAGEIIQTLLVMARCVRPGIEHARVLTAALHDMVLLYPQNLAALTEVTADSPFPNAAHIARTAVRLLGRRGVL